MLYEGNSYAIGVNKLSPLNVEHLDRITTDPNLEWIDSVIGSISGIDDVSRMDNDLRKSRNTWIKDKRLTDTLWFIVNEYNKRYLNLKLVANEDIQYSEYCTGGFYDWHVDQFNVPSFYTDNKIPLVRKISLSLFLNDPDEYEGGELDVEIGGPRQDPRYATYKLEKGSVVIFQSNVWHRVRPVTSGKRKSLVVWFAGPPYT